MKSDATQTCSRAVGLFFWVCGVGIVAICFVPADAISPVMAAFPRWITAAVLLILASGLFRTAYLSWFRWSPLAIRHIVGGMFFFVTLFCLFYVPSQVPTGWGLYTFLAAYPVCYTMYRTIAYLLS